MEGDPTSAMIDVQRAHGQPDHVRYTSLSSTGDFVTKEGQRMKISTLDANTCVAFSDKAEV